MNIATECHRFDDPGTGMVAFLCYHGDLSQPAIGGCRIHPYTNELDAKKDAIDLARCMYMKAKTHHLPLCGAKMVCWGDPHSIPQRHGFFKRLAAFIQQQQGRYVVAMDSGVTLDDMDAMSQYTQYICNNSTMGNPAPYTAMGVNQSIVALNKHVLKQPLNQLSLAIYGVGAVGAHIINFFRHRVTLYACDIRPNPQQNLGSEGIHWLAPHELLRLPCDILAPCAVGTTIHSTIVDDLSCKIIAGAANNPMEQSITQDILKKKSITYTPDYVINGGGLIYCAAQYFKQPAWLNGINDIPFKVINHY